jgi:hypothetical protein
LVLLLPLFVVLGRVGADLAHGKTSRVELGKLLLEDEGEEEEEEEEEDKEEEEEKRRTASAGQ